MPIQPPSARPNDAASPQAEGAHDYRPILHELILMGMDIARAVHAQAQAEAAPPAESTTIAFDRISRTIRRTVALSRRLDEPVPQRAERDPAQHREAARRSIIRQVEDTIRWRQQWPKFGENEEALRAELRERLDGPDIEDDVGHRPIAEIIADICHDLGLGRSSGAEAWKRRTPADIAELCARAAQPRRAGPPLGGAEAAERFFHLVAAPNTA